MKVKIKETGAIKTLRVTDPGSGANVAADIIEGRNTEQGEDCPVMELADFYWWTGKLVEYQVHLNKIHELTKQHGLLHVLSVLGDLTPESDFEMFLDELEQALAEVGK